MERGAPPRDLWKAVQSLKRESGKGLCVGGEARPALTELGLIDEHEFVVHPRLAGQRANVVRGAVEASST